MSSLDAFSSLAAAESIQLFTSLIRCWTLTVGWCAGGCVLTAGAVKSVVCDDTIAGAGLLFGCTMILYIGWIGAGLLFVGCVAICWLPKLLNG